MGLTANSQWLRLPCHDHPRIPVLVQGESGLLLLGDTNNGATD